MRATAAVANGKATNNSQPAGPVAARKAVEWTSARPAKTPRKAAPPSPTDQAAWRSVGGAIPSQVPRAQARPATNQAAPAATAAGWPSAVQGWTATRQNDPDRVSELVRPAVTAAPATTAGARTAPCHHQRQPSRPLAALTAAAATAGMARARNGRWTWGPGEPLTAALTRSDTQADSATTRAPAMRVLDEKVHDVGLFPAIDVPHLPSDVHQLGGGRPPLTGRHPDGGDRETPPQPGDGHEGRLGVVGRHHEHAGAAAQPSALGGQQLGDRRGTV